MTRRVRHPRDLPLFLGRRPRRRRATAGVSHRRCKVVRRQRSPTQQDSEATLSASAASLAACRRRHSRPCALAMAPGPVRRPENWGPASPGRNCERHWKGQASKPCWHSGTYQRAGVGTKQAYEQLLTEKPPPVRFSELKLSPGDEHRAQAIVEALVRERRRQLTKPGL